MEFVPRPCDRCGAGTIDNDYSQEREVAPMCAEFHMAYGVIAWLCFDCRASWYKAVDEMQLMKEYEEESFRLEHWKNIVAGGEVEEGLEILQRVTGLERSINRYAYKWLVSSDT